MHMDYVDVSLKDTYIAKSTLLGQSGNSGGDYDPHLHYGIFLKSENMNPTDWNDYPLNPLWFFTPNDYNM